MTPDANSKACRKYIPPKCTTQSLQQASDVIRSLEEKVEESKRLFEREFQLQTLLNEDLSKQLAVKTKPIHAQLGTSSSLIGTIQDEDALWSNAIEMTNLSHQAQDAQFASVLREGERIVETIMHHNFDKRQLTDAVDDLIRTLEAT